MIGPLKTRHAAVLLPLVMTALALSGCTPGKPIRGEPQVVASPDKVSAMLAEAADRASVALETLAAVEQARSPEATIAPAENVPPELKRAITVNWVGPLEPIVKTLADRASYAFQVIGAPPSVPIVVSVDVENKPVIEVLRSLGLQLGTRAILRVDAAAHMVEIQYVANTGLGR